MLYALYLGFDNGDFYELINLDHHDSVRHRFRANVEDKWVEIRIRGEGAQRHREFTFLDKRFEVREVRAEFSDYFAFRRPWFQQAGEGHINKSAPYQFQHLQLPGQTYSVRLPKGQAVLALDITLEKKQEYLQQILPHTESQAFIHLKYGTLLGSSHTVQRDNVMSAPDKLSLTPEQKQLISQVSPLKVSNELNWPPFDFSIAGLPQGYAIDVIRLIEQMTGLSIEFINGYSWATLFEMFNEGQLDMVHPVVDTPQNQQAGLLSAPMLTSPQALLTHKTQHTFRRLADLDNKTLAIPKGWSSIPLIKAHYPTIHILEVENTYEALTAVKRGDAFGTLDMKPVLEQSLAQYFINDLSFHPEFDEPLLPDALHLLLDARHSALLPIINQALEIINRDYHSILAEKWLGAPNVELDGYSSSVVPYKNLVEIAQNPLQQNVLLRQTLKGNHYYIYVTPLNQDSMETEYFSIITPVDQLLAQSYQQVKESVFYSVIVLLLLLPFSRLFAHPIVKPIKHLARENQKIQRREYDQVTFYNSRITEVYELALSQIGVKDAFKRYEDQQDALVNSFIKTFTLAIDDKSPYTGNHCARVPSLTMMLLDAAEHSAEPVFKKFIQESEHHRQEIQMAAWLHDCGKISTPEFVIDKATKLETVYNRIHEIRMRFEVLWRDAEIEALNLSLAEPENHASHIARCQQQQEILLEELGFIAKLNIGSEHVKRQDIERLNIIGKRCWHAHFNGHLGLSHAEASRLKGQPFNPEQTLLSDRPEHIIMHERDAPPSAEYGITMQRPAYRFNLGEYYNLSIDYGTLTSEERYIVNEHIVGTIKILNNLSFPPELKNVPRYASTHHETLDGKGYPRGLCEKDLSMGERMIILADVFEALTASDRPYKQAKSLKEALDILLIMVKDKRVDKDVFRLFLTSGVHRDYIHQYYPSREGLELDITPYLTEVAG